MKIWRIYKITARDGRAYVGVTCRDLSARWSQHVHDATRGAGFALHNAIKKHGAGYFTIEEITVCFSAKEASVCERAQIAAHGTFARTGNGFNLTLGGDGNWGWKPSAAALRKMSEKGKLRALNPELQRRLTEGKRRSKKIGKFTRTPEMRAATAARFRNKPLSEEAVKKIRATSTGRTHSESTREKMRANWAARKAAGWRPSPETCARISASKSGRPRGEPLSREEVAKRATIRRKLARALTRVAASENKLFAEQRFVAPLVEA